MAGIEFPPPLSVETIEDRINKAVAKAVADALVDYVAPPNEQTIRLWARDEAEDVLSGVVAPPLPRTVIASSTLEASDIRSGAINVNATGLVQILVPADLPTGATLTLNQLGDGQFDIVAGQGVTVDIPEGFTRRSSGKLAVVYLSRVSLNRWLASSFGLLPAAGTDTSATWPNGSTVQWGNGASMEF